MSHFAQIEDGVVTNVIAADQDFIDNHMDGEWVQTSYNTRGGKHYAPNSNEEDSGTPLRKNYAGIGMIYDSARDAFYVPQPYPSWTLDDDTCLWEFTEEQARRMRCTIEHWRPNLASQCSMASISMRNAGKNLNTYTATQPVMGSQFTATVNLQGTGYTTAALFGLTGAATGPTINGYVLLVDFSSPLGDLLPLPYQSGPIATFTFPVPMLPALCGFKLYTQAAHFGGQADFSLSNSQDLIFGKR